MSFVSGSTEPFRKNQMQIHVELVYELVVKSPTNVLEKAILLSSVQR